MLLWFDQYKCGHASGTFMKESGGGGEVIAFQRITLIFSGHWTPKQVIINTYQGPTQLSTAGRKTASFLCLTESIPWDWSEQQGGYIVTKRT